MGNAKECLALMVRYINIMSHKYVNFVKNSKCFTFCFRQVANATCVPHWLKPTGMKLSSPKSKVRDMFCTPLGNAKECLALTVEVYKHNVT